MSRADNARARTLEAIEDNYEFRKRLNDILDQINAAASKCRFHTTIKLQPPWHSIVIGYLRSEGFECYWKDGEEYGVQW